MFRSLRVPSGNSVQSGTVPDVYVFADCVQFNPPMEPDPISLQSPVEKVSAWLSHYTGQDAANKLADVSAKTLFGLTEQQLRDVYELNKRQVFALQTALWPLRGTPPNEQLQRCAN